MVSAPLGVEPLMGLSLPSNCTEKPYEMGFPSAATAANVYFTPSPCASTGRVRFFGAGPGTNFDFATLSFQVPTSGLSWARKPEEATTANREIARKRKTCLICETPLYEHDSNSALHSLLETDLNHMPRKTCETI